MENLKSELGKIGVSFKEDLEALARELNARKIVAEDIYHYLEEWLDKETDPDIVGELLVYRQYFSTEREIISRCLDLVEEIQKEQRNA